MEENKTFIKPAYKCAICGKEHSSVQERMNCEMKCLKKQQEDEKAAVEAKKRAEKDARKKEVDEAFENLLKLHNAYVKDYGYYEFEKNGGKMFINCSYPHFPSRFWHDLLF